MTFKQSFLVRCAAAVALAALLLAGGCSFFLAGLAEGVSGQNPPPEGAASQITSAADTVTLAWDPSSGAVTSYKVFYRQHGTADWTMLSEVPAQASPTLTLHQADFGNGSFDFGVEAVSDTGAESQMHTSLDPTAQPTSGWYLTWNL